MEVEVADPQSKDAPTSTLAFCPEGPFLAAGAMGDIKPKLRLLRSTPGAYLFDELGSFWSPAPLRRVCWSDAFSSGSSRPLAGLIARGLENGSVVVWDPHKKISDWNASEYDAGEMELKERLKLERGEFRTRANSFRLDQQHIGQRKPSPPLLDKMTSNFTPSTGAAHGLVASLRPSFPAQRGPFRQSSIWVG
ncbi:uncharacterized protein LOC119315761 [Triticum dicoccoides]|uniref:uncharacterized protein LOC119315761 n=1 Tax=Triticum dicoccoides TaxID=85692 RepID=UPI001890E7EF|nr:uncharacterized protein LOC119315761 [Triticum dicoccoides]